MSKILVVDDRLLNRQLLVKLLVSRHHFTWEASDGAEALQVARTERPDLVISDVLMPTMDGFEFVSQLRADPLIGQTPVIFITGNYLGREARALAESYGVSTILYRPFDKKEVLHSVDAALESDERPVTVPPPEREEFDREHLQLLTNTLSEKSDQLSDVNLKLTALIELEREIAERRKAEESLRESEIRYRRLFEAARDGILILNADTLKITDVNPFMTELLGYSRAEFLGKELWEIGLFSDKEASLATFRELQQTGYIRYADLPLQTIEGKPCEVEFVSNVYEEDGRQVIQCNVRDITERKLTEETRDRLAAIVESSDDAILSKTFEGVVTSWNAGAERMYGYTAAEAIGQHLSFIIPPERAEELASIHHNLESGVRIKHLETVRVRKDGSKIDVSISISPIIGAEGRVLGASTIAREITERKRAEAAMRAKQEELLAMTQQLWQSSKLATIGELAAGIAHELNNPLATVSLRTEFLFGQCAGDDPKQDALKIIEQEVERMAKLVGNLLQFSRRSHAQISTIDVYREIENTLDFIEHHLRSRQINVVREFADSLPSLHADNQQLRQVFLNLLANASDAMPQGGTLTLRVTAGRTAHGASAIVIEFVDTGTGIKPEDLLKVWEPFFTTKDEGKGTGLGLAICRRIVEEHKGTINIESKVGQGTTVRITLPATEGERDGTRSV